MIRGPQKPAVKSPITTSWWYEPAVMSSVLVLVLNWQWCCSITVGFSWADCGVELSLSILLEPTVIVHSTKGVDLLLPPTILSSAHSGKQGARSPSSIVAAAPHQNAQWRSWIFNHGHNLLDLRLVTSMHFFKFIAFQLYWWIDCLISHSSYFSILESTFYLDLEEGIQIVVNQSSKRLASCTILVPSKLHDGFEDC